VELRHIAWGNLRRRRGKALLIVAGLSLAVAAFILVISLVLSVRGALDDKLTRYGSNMVVAPASDELTLAYGGTVVAGAGSGRVRVLAEEDVAAIRSVPAQGQLTAVIPVLLQPVSITAEGDSDPTGEVAGETGASATARPTFLAMGTDMVESLRVKLWWKMEGQAPEAPDEVLLGLNVRNALDVQVGDALLVDGRRVTISGVLWETGGEEDNLLIMDRDVLARWSGRPGEANLIEVTASDMAAVDTLTRQIEDAVPAASVTSVKRSLEFTSRANSALERFGLAVALLVVAISGLVVTITMLTAVKERRREIGVLRAVGYKQRHIARLILLEAVVLSAAAAAVGVLLGLAGGLLAPVVAPGLSLEFVLHPWVAVSGVLVSFVVGLAASLYPAWRAAMLDPARALRFI
jgi:putative ABC transport system permease protein